MESESSSAQSKPLTRLLAENKAEMAPQPVQEKSDCSLQSELQSKDSTGISTPTNKHQALDSTAVSSEMENIPQENAAFENAGQHVITSPTGQQYIAHIYEQGADGQPIAETEGVDHAESNMARKLCFNLLNEFVKGNSRIKKTVLEETAKLNADQTHAALEASKPQSQWTQENKPTSDSFDKVNDEHIDEPPFKKAKFAWQIKNSQRRDPANSISEESEEESNESVIDNDLLHRKFHSPCNIQPGTETSSSDSSSESSEADYKHNLPVHQQPVETDCLHDTSSSHVNISTSPPSTDTNSAKYDRLQSHHIAKSIVDNAINKTLEEMGLSPNQVENRIRQQFRHQRQRIEDVGVAEVIRERGLHGPHRHSSDFPSLHRRPPGFRPPNTVPETAAQRLYPLINRLTEVSENMFVENVRRGQRVSTRIELGRVNVPPTTYNVHTPEIMEDQDAEADTPTVTSESPTCSMDENAATPSSIDSEDTGQSQTDDTVDTTVNSATDIEQIEKERLSSSYVLDRALNAAITERGLQY